MLEILLFVCFCITIWGAGWKIIDMMASLAANIKFRVWKRKRT